MTGPDPGMVVLAGRHLDQTEGIGDVGHALTAGDVAALRTVLAAAAIYAREHADADVDHLAKACDRQGLEFTVTARTGTECAWEAWAWSERFTGGDAVVRGHAAHATGKATAAEAVEAACAELRRAIA